jgi:hypothetical protein
MGLEVACHQIWGASWYNPVLGLYMNAGTSSVYRFQGIYVNGLPFKCSPILGNVIAVFIEWSNSTYFRARSHSGHPYYKQFAVNIRSLLPYYIRYSSKDPIGWFDEIVNQIVDMLCDPKHRSRISSSVIAFKYRDCEPDFLPNGQPNILLDKKGQPVVHKKTGKFCKQYLIPGPILRSPTSVLIAILQYGFNNHILAYPGVSGKVLVSRNIRTTLSSEFISALNVLHLKPIEKETYRADSFNDEGVVLSKKEFLFPCAPSRPLDMSDIAASLHDIEPERWADLADA